MAQRGPVLGPLPQQQFGKPLGKQGAGLDAEDHISGQLRLSRKERRDDAVAKELLVYRIGLDVLGVELDRSGAAT